MKSNASSSLTASTHLNIQGITDATHTGRSVQILPKYSDQVHSIRIPDNGTLLTAQQVNQLLHSVEQQALQVFSGHIATALAFHNPNSGMKSMIVEQFNLYHERMKKEIATISRQKSEEQVVNISRTKSLNDLHVNSAIQVPRIMAEIGTIENDSVDSKDELEQEVEESNKIPGNFADTFNLPPKESRKPAIQLSSQPTSEVATTPMAEVIHPPPGSYHGSIREIGDGIIKTLDAVLEGATSNDDEKKKKETLTDANLNDPEAQSEEENDEEEDAATATESEINQQAPRDKRSSRRIARQPPSSEPNQQTQSESTTGDPTKKPGKSTRMKS
jgi:hypothetical protein